MQKIIRHLALHSIMHVLNYLQIYVHC